MIIHSFDVGYKNLGVCVAELKNNTLKILYLDTWDISQNFVKNNVQVLGYNLYNKILILDKFPQCDVMIYENTMNINDKSKAVQNFLIYEYCTISQIRATAAAKNTVYFHNDLKIQNFLPRYSTSYSANKAQTKANLEYYIEQHDIKLELKKKDDAADAFMQIIAIYFPDCHQLI